MATPITLIHPKPNRPQPLAGSYLHAPLASAATQSLFIYANFVCSLDGRIALRETDSRGGVPVDIANSRDWRLFQELAARADVLLSSGRYFRELASGDAQAPLPVAHGNAFADLHAWRRDQDLAPQPDVAIFSTRLDFTVPRGLLDEGRRVLVLTTATAKADAVQRLAAQGIEVARISPGAYVRGTDAATELRSRGYRRAYSVTGPWVLHTLVANDLVNSLFLTTVHRLVGGRRYTSLLEGNRLAPAPAWELRWLYHDPYGPGGSSQQFARYDRVTPLPEYPRG